MTARLRKARDERNWRVPACSSRSHEIYLLMRVGLEPAQIPKVIGGSVRAVHVLAWRIRNPDDHNTVGRDYHAKKRTRHMERIEA